MANNGSDPSWAGPAYAHTIARPTRQHRQGIDPAISPSPMWTVLTETVHVSAGGHLRDHQWADQDDPVDHVLPDLRLSQDQVCGAGHRYHFARPDAVRHPRPALPVHPDREDVASLRAGGIYPLLPSPAPAASAPHTPSGECCY